MASDLTLSIAVDATIGAALSAFGSQEGKGFTASASAPETMLFLLPKG